MRTEVYWIAGPWPGRLAIVPRPRGGDWLEDEVRFWRDSGLDIVVSLLTPDEITELDLDQEERWCQAHGIQFRSFPIPDRGVPTSQKAAGELVKRLEEALEAGKSIAVHCRQGIGRSGLIAATVLVSAGEDPETALGHISRARGCPVPDTVEQYNWVKDFASVPMGSVPRVRGAKALRHADFSEGLGESMDKRLSSRRREALALAERCARVLQDRFGARRVIPFGSVVGEGPWHEGSDLDLAVEGLSSEALREAERELEAMAPPWLEVDLVPLERVYPDVRARILGGRPMPEDLCLALKARLEDELVGLERIAQGLEAALERVGGRPDEFAIRALASYVDDFYQGCERICERVAVTLDGGLPRGKRWPQVLLGRMGEPGGRGRPVLFDGSLLLELDEYRRFRHRVRPIYGYESEAERVLTLARGVKSILEQVQAAVAAFNAWLEEQAGRGD